ncbi:MAG TPA: radical SAM protein [Dissulfurispiraceae bacterium]|nr:radical SAM protein [Dissulfurispiraceae bacterium]
MILIYPPVSKPCEPPAGIAKLSGALKHDGIKHTVLDANLEGLLHLLNSADTTISSNNDTWTKRALRNLSVNLRAIRDPKTYLSIDRYRLAVMDVNKVLETCVAGDGIALSLANYQHGQLSPVRSADLLCAAEHPELNPFYKYFKNRLAGLVEKDRPSMVGFSLTYLSQALCTFAMLGFLRREYPELKIVCGGGLVTSWLRRPGCDVRKLFAGLVDHFVEGPGEAALLELVGQRHDSIEHYTPEYNLLPVAEYMSAGPILPYSGSSGCIWRKCSFCPEKAEGNRYAPVRPESAVNDLAFLATRMKPALIHLLDNSLSPALVKSLIAHPPGVPWYGFARIDSDLTDIDYCRALKRSGCVMLKLGIESGDQAVLDRMNKGIDLGTVSSALRTLRRAGIAAYVYLLFGTPEETLSGARKTLEFTAKHCNEISFLNLAVFNMPAGAPEALMLATSGFYEGDLSLYTDFSHPEGWGRRQVRQFLDGEFRRHSAISAILKNEPPFFTSNHAPFFVMSDR